jgi:hypothetical protein
VEVPVEVEKIVEGPEQEERRRLVRRQQKEIENLRKELERMGNQVADQKRAETLQQEKEDQVKQKLGFWATSMPQSDKKPPADS